MKAAPEMSPPIDFGLEIERNKNADIAPGDVIHIATANERSSLRVRERGCFVTELELTSPTTGERVAVFYPVAEQDLNRPKLSASHIMSPVGPSEGIGGQHGYARWANWNKSDEMNSSNGNVRLDLRSGRYDKGVILAKNFVLGESSLLTNTKLFNSGAESVHTSVGEHNYFAVSEAELGGIKINGATLDQVFGVGATETLTHNRTPDGSRDGTQNLAEFDREVLIQFPAGHVIKISSQLDGKSEYKNGLWVWHRPETNSVCFEPFAGYGDGHNDGITLEPYDTATFTTNIELL